MATRKGVILQELDIKWLKYLASGPGRISEAAIIYNKTGIKDYGISRIVYRRIQKLEKGNYLVKRDYPNMQKSLFCYLGPNGEDELVNNYGYEPEYIRNKVAPNTGIQHEILLSGVLHKIYQDSLDQMRYKVLYAYDDTMKQNGQIRKGRVPYDLKVGIEYVDGKKTELFFLFDGWYLGSHLTRSLYVEKLGKIKEPLFVITLASIISTARLELLYRYSVEAFHRPPEISLCPYNEFLKNGLNATRWLTFPERIEDYLAQHDLLCPNHSPGEL